MSMPPAVAEHDGTRDASHLLDVRLNEMHFGQARIHVVLGYPRSDIGKAELVARLGLLLERKFSIIKVDGFLNTNRHGQHPSRVRNDFVIYRKFHDHIEFGGSHLILSAILMTEFFETYGECKEHLMFRPHLAQFFAHRIYLNWIALGRPNDLIVEVGGTLTDPEVSAFSVPGLRLLQQKHPNVKFFLLTEAGYSGESIKAKPAINALERAQGCGLQIDLVFARLPAEFPSQIDLIEAARHIQQKICDAMVLAGRAPRVICIPFFPGKDLTGYSELLASRKELIFPPKRQPTLTAASTCS